MEKESKRGVKDKILKETWKSTSKTLLLRNKKCKKKKGMRKVDIWIPLCNYAEFVLLLIRWHKDDPSSFGPPDKIHSIIGLSQYQKHPAKVECLLVLGRQSWLLSPRWPGNETQQSAPLMYPYTSFNTIGLPTSSSQLWLKPQPTPATV